ncbi:Ribonucleotide reductase inhibitor [Geosmithia morbida]|uniref:Ribonucleotide reductase inhibitor n=1 Tax=Geosmithia morbida TaxID=1094350 RepID=A0A9P4YTJ4_9HYPO|nr:Ribonucleotide reductase inhibitor [Geosmithia morbida]KAF4122843.1 Ribonucleotide reductase inhibitor [Geosmithia morbida]
MSNPRVKRAFVDASSDPSQRQITSFFNTHSNEGGTGTTAESVQPPQLPASIEANLLSVGMRIRKSVPEGYKTNSTSAFKLWTDNTPLPTSSNPNASATSRPVAAVSRELLPFCGINKIGGLDCQPTTTHLDDSEGVPSIDDIPGLTLSQESVESSAVEASPNNVRKRFYDDDDDTIEPVHQSVSAADDVSPRTLTPVGFGNARSRAIAVPRTRTLKKNSVPGTETATMPVDQENMAVDGDFDEADFLVFDSNGLDTTN